MADEEEFAALRDRVLTLETQQRELMDTLIETRDALIETRQALIETRRHFMDRVP